jgi:HPr kinase/phosphorylase
VGLLYVGQSSIGKSECVLDLVERGHRLVADDAVRLGNSIVGRSNSVIKSHMEIRGLGIIDVRSMFGVKSVRRVKKIEMVVELRNWNQAESYERTGLDHLYDEIMGVQIPRVVIPVSPGKNITVISEVIAMNKLMKSEGVDSAKLLDEALRAEIERKMKGEATHELFQGEIWDFYE